MAIVKSYLRLHAVVCGIMVFGIVFARILGSLDTRLPLMWASDRSGNWEIYIWDSRSGALVNISRTPGTDSAPVWSGNGQLAWQSQHEGNWNIHMWDSRNLKMFIIRQESGNFGGLDLSRDGRLRWLAYEQNELDIFTWDSHTGEIRNISRSFGMTGTTTWSDDGLLAWGGPRRRCGHLCLE